MIRAATLILALTASPAVANDHAEVRAFVIRSQLTQAGDDSVIVIGDSIVESALLPSNVCGHPLINAGVGGSTVSSYLRLILGGMPRFKASVIVVALGTNDALAQNENFGQDYAHFLDVLVPYADAMLLTGLPSVGDQLDQDIRSVAQRRELPFINVRPAPTIDGIHLSAEGYKPWLDAVLGGIRRVLRC